MSNTEIFSLLVMILFGSMLVYAGLKSGMPKDLYDEKN